MPARTAFFLSLLTAALVAGSACAMNSDVTRLTECRVTGGGKLSADSGGPDAICAAIAEAAAAASPKHAFSVEVRVIGNSRLAATLTTANGEKLPELNFAESDRLLSKDSFGQFAKALVGEVARANGN